MGVAAFFQKKMKIIGISPHNFIKKAM